jgi:site-specific recombinase XerC
LAHERRRRRNICCNIKDVLFEPFRHVSAYVEVLGRRYRAPTVKQHLAAIRMLFDWLIVGQFSPGPNPAAAVRGPKHVIKIGETSVLDATSRKS